MYTKYASCKRFRIFKIAKYLYIYLRIGLNFILLTTLQDHNTLKGHNSSFILIQVTIYLSVNPKHLANLKMIFLLLLAILPLSYQDITEKQQEFCTRNDNGDIWKYDLTSLGLVDKP